jgi:tripartite ATP-independent transporter DctM subunit
MVVAWIIFGLFFLFLVLGCPIAISMGSASLLYTMFIEKTSLIVIAQRISSDLFSFTFLAVPMFLLAGNLMNEIGVTDRLFRFARGIIGHIPGGLGHVNVLASMIFAGLSGSAIADAAGLGVIEIRAMREAGYDDDFSGAITAASSTIGPIIPPSIMMVLYGVLAEVSVGQLFLASFIPGAVMGLCLMIAIYIQVVRGQVKAPLDKRPTLREFFVMFYRAIPPLMSPVILIGGMMIGLFTATEAAAVACGYTILLGLATKQLKWDGVKRSLKSTVTTTCSILLIIGSAHVFTWVITVHKIPEMITAGILSITQNKILVILLIDAIILLLGMIMSVNALLILLIPILLSIASAVGINLVHMGVFVVLGLQIGLVTPPVGMVLYIISDIASVSLERLSKTLIPYIIALIASLVIVSVWEDLVLFLPRLLGGYHL